MSKVQDAINAAKKQAGKTGTSFIHSIDERPDARRESAPVQLGDFPKLALDPDQMERSCLLPYIKDHAATNAYKLLRTRLLQRMRSHQWKSVIVTGTLPSDGKTTTAINLSIGVSQDVSQPVLLVDLDLQRSAVAKSLGLKPSAGLSDYLSGDAEIGDIIYNSDLERLALLPNFGRPQASDESLVSPKMLALLDYIKRLDPNLLIIFDMPPILVSDDVLAFGPHVDSLLLVISEGRTNRAMLQRANQMIEDIPRIGTVLNRSSESNSIEY